MTTLKLIDRLPISAAVLALTCSMSLMSCGNKPLATPGSVGAAPGAAAKTGAATAPTGTGDGKTCDNPISLDESELSPVIDASTLPKGNYKLSSMQLYVHHASNGSSLLASAQASNQFEAKLDCGAVAPTVESLTDSFDAPETLDTTAGRTEGTTRKSLEVKFEKGQLVGAKTASVNASAFPDAPNWTTQAYPQDRFQTTSGNAYTMRVYILPTHQLELRIKTESVTEGTPGIPGSSDIKITRAVYDLVQ